ncbi:MAG: hypothetical protein HKN24_09370, partial [Acidimicrobiales bacterium]|nr:hypothetical protein [Acidimicrobiales bacterium]
SAPCTLSGGDVLTTLGGGARPGVSPLAYPIDLVDVRLDDDRRFTSVAHVIAHNALWRGQFLVAMNAAWVGRLYLGPRSHPNDGLVDVTTGSLPWQQRLMARRRAATGSHLPHPRLRATRTAAFEYGFDRPTPVWIDGMARGRARRLSLEVIPDAGVVVV